MGEASCRSKCWRMRHVISKARAEAGRESGSDDHCNSQSPIDTATSKDSIGTLCMHIVLQSIPTTSENSSRYIRAASDYFSAIQVQARESQAPRALLPAKTLQPPPIYEGERRDRRPGTERPPGDVPLTYVGYKDGFDAKKAIYAETATVHPNLIPNDISCAQKRIFLCSQTQDFLPCESIHTA